MSSDGQFFSLIYIILLTNTPMQTITMHSLLTLKDHSKLANVC
jgi:hypothetical protein